MIVVTLWCQKDCESLHSPYFFRQNHFTIFVEFNALWQLRKNEVLFLNYKTLCFKLSFNLLFFRHFLFKTSSGTTPLFSSSSPGYPLTSGTVYTPPPRLLPRNTFSRNAFKLKKPSKYCSWKCAALSAIAAAVLLAILLAYFIGKTVFSLSNHIAMSANEASADERLV